MGILIKNQIISKLDQLERCTEILSVSAGYMEADFIRCPLICAGAERYLYLGKHRVREVCLLLRDVDKLPPKDDEPLLHMLANNNVFPAWLAENLLIDSKYLSQGQNDETPDQSKLYGKLDGFISDFRHFKKYVLEYLI